MKYIFLSFLFALNSLANDVYELSEDELDPSSEDILTKKSEKFLRDESMIYNFNTQLGIKDQRKYTGRDSNRLTAAFHLAGDYEHLTEILGAEINYMSRSSKYDRFWWGAQIFQHKAHFRNITENSFFGGANSEASFRRPSGTKDSLLGFGPGIGYRFKLFLDFLPTEDTFETVEVFLNALLLDESFIEEKYQGYGLSASYGLHKRTKTSFYYGGKFSYHVATVTRRAIGDESESERSLSLGWLSIALDVGFFY
jgi:hypothetical protein